MNSLFNESVFIEMFSKLKIKENGNCIFDPYMGRVKVQSLHGQCLPYFLLWKCVGYHLLSQYDIAYET